MEALDSILTCLHESLAKKREDGSSDYCEPACLVHQVSALSPAACFSSSLSHALSLLQVFGINVMEQSECSKCGCSSEPVLSQGWIHYGYTNDLMYPFRLLPGFWRVPYAHVRVFRSFAQKRPRCLPTAWLREVTPSSRRPGSALVCQRGEQLCDYQTIIAMITYDTLLDARHARQRAQLLDSSSLPTPTSSLSV